MFPLPQLRFRWVLIGWIFAISAIAYLDRVNISIAGKAIASEFHLDYVQLGWIQSAFVLGYALFQAPGGRIADRAGPRIVLTAGVIWWGVFTVLITALPAGNSSALWLLIGIRFGLGVGEAVVYPASNCVLACWIPSAERGIANGIIFAGVGFGAGVASPLITQILIRHGWRTAFWWSAGLGLAAGAVWYVIARDSPAKHPWISRSELQEIEAGIAASLDGGKGRLSWSEVFTNRNILAISFSYFTYGYAAYIFFSWYFIYLNDVRGLNLKESSYYTMLPFLAMAIGSPVGGWISDRWTRKRGKRAGRCGVAVVGIAFAAVFIALGTQVASARIASLVLAGGAGALYLSQSSFWSVSADIGRQSAGSVSGVMNMVGQLGGALTASLTPAIASHLGWTASFLTAAALCVFGALAWLVVDPESEKDKLRDHSPQRHAVESGWES